MSSMPETWKTLEGWPYEVSTWGAVRRASASARANGPAGLVMRQYLTNKGYLFVGLRQGPGVKQSLFRVHRLVLQVFVGPCPDRHNCNHKDGNKQNNRLDNLEWVTPSRNQLHAIEMGLSRGQGQEQAQAKLTDQQVVEIRLGYKGEWGEQGRTAAKYGVSQNLISKIVRGDAWTHLDPPWAAVVAKRAKVGAAHGRAKLTTKQVQGLRVRAAGGESEFSLAETLGVSPRMIRNIVNRKTWKHVS